VVATPIGNLDDISLRAISSLARADFIAAEDTRVTAHLLDRHGLRGKLLAVHEHNEMHAADRIIAQLAQGKTVALVSDAGTPAISDPGAKLVAKVRASGFRVVPIPGPNAAVTALSASGIADGPFLFVGFLPASSAARRKALRAYADLPYALVFYEAPHRVVECVEDLTALLDPQRPIVVARELTKVFEQIHQCLLGEAADWLRADADRQRGEFVLILEGAHSPKTDDEGWEYVLATLLQDLPLAQAVKLACKLTGARKNAVYARALQLAGRPDAGRR
jgi:16S rRNA (cytidine1402-2'-O)-methyltransferase